jgi:hypothetical protein
MNFSFLFLLLASSTPAVLSANDVHDSDSVSQETERGIDYIPGTDRIFYSSESQETERGVEFVSRGSIPSGRILYSIPLSVRDVDPSDRSFWPSTRPDKPSASTCWNYMRWLERRPLFTYLNFYDKVLSEAEESGGVLLEEKNFENRTGDADEMITEVQDKIQNQIETSKNEGSIDNTSNTFDEVITRQRLFIKKLLRRVDQDAQNYNNNSHPINNVNDTDRESTFASVANLDFHSRLHEIRSHAANVTMNQFALEWRDYREILFKARKSISDSRFRDHGLPFQLNSMDVDYSSAESRTRSVANIRGTLLRRELVIDGICWDLMKTLVELMMGYLGDVFLLKNVWQYTRFWGLENGFKFGDDLDEDDVSINHGDVVGEVQSQSQSNGASVAHTNINTVNVARIHTGSSPTSFLLANVQYLLSNILDLKHQPTLYLNNELLDAVI